MKGYEEAHPRMAATAASTETVGLHGRKTVRPIAEALAGAGLGMVGAMYAASDDLSTVSFEGTGGVLVAIVGTVFAINRLKKGFAH